MQLGCALVSTSCFCSVQFCSLRVSYSIHSILWRWQSKLCCCNLNSRNLQASSTCIVCDYCIAEPLWLTRVQWQHCGGIWHWFTRTTVSGFLYSWGSNVSHSVGCTFILIQSEKAPLLLDSLENLFRPVRSPEDEFYWHGSLKVVRNLSFQQSTVVPQWF